MFIKFIICHYLLSGDFNFSEQLYCYKNKITHKANKQTKVQYKDNVKKITKLYETDI